jgi:hypothetical protein
MRLLLSHKHISLFPRRLARKYEAKKLQQINKPKTGQPNLFVTEIKLIQQNRIFGNIFFSHSSLIKCYFHSGFSTCFIHTPIYKRFCFTKLSLLSSHIFFVLTHCIITNVITARLNGLSFSQLHWRPSSIPVPHEYLRVAILTLVAYKPVAKLSSGLEYFTLFLCNRTRFIDTIMLKPTIMHEYDSHKSASHFITF